jgi:hypothetical protein
MSNESIQTELEYERFVDEIVQRFEALMAYAGAPSFEVGMQQGIWLFESVGQFRKKSRPLLTCGGCC